MSARRERAREPKRAGRVSLVLYTRRSCPLCDEMKGEIEELGASHPLELKEVDIDGDPALVERFGLSVPVLEIGGRVAFEGRLNQRDLRLVLEQRRGKQEDP